MSDRLLFDVARAITAMEPGELSEHDCRQVDRLLRLVGAIKTIEHGRLWYELVWCQRALIERHRQRVLELVQQMQELTAFTPLDPHPAPATWTEARMLALKRNCPDCVWWRGRSCSARDLAADTAGKGQLPAGIRDAMAECRREQAANSMQSVRLDAAFD